MAVHGRITRECMDRRGLKPRREASVGVVMLEASSTICATASGRAGDSTSMPKLVGGGMYGRHMAEHARAGCRTRRKPRWTAK
eukprot:3848383-Prymnesium_polylepis.1